MPSHDADDTGAIARSRSAQVVVRTLGVVVVALVAYACWRGYQSPDFLLGVAAAFGLC